MVPRLNAREGGETDAFADGGSAGQGGRLAARGRMTPKKRVTMYMDADVLAWFKSGGPGYQREINRMLRRVMVEEQDAG